MASSSDWIAALEAQDQPEDKSEEPAWMAALREPTGFIEGAPFAPAPPLPPSPDQPAPVELAEEEPEAEPKTDLVAQALERGFAEGHAAGLAEAHVQHASTDNQMRSLRLSFRSFDQAATDAFAHELAETVIALCSGALEGFAADPDALIERCKEAAKRLGNAAQDCKLHLNPADIAALDPVSLEPWEIVPDQGVAPAGLRFEGPDGLVSDGPKEWRRAIAAAIRG